MRDPYEARDPGGTDWRTGPAHRPDPDAFPPPAADAGPDHTLPRRPPPDRDDTGASSDTMNLGYPLPSRPAPAYEGSAPGYDHQDPASIYDRGGPAPSYDRNDQIPPFERNGHPPPRRDPGYAAVSDTGLTAPVGPPPDDPMMTAPGREADGRQISGGDPDDDTTGTPPPRHVEVEPAVPAGQQIRESIARIVSSVRRSIPLRTVLFLLPPLALPALAFDLSVVATVLVALTLLWLATASAVFCMMMLEGNQELALRSIEHRSDRPGGAAGDGRPDDEDLQEALLVIGAQLDTLTDAVAALGEGAGQSPKDDDVEILSHRQREQQWPSSPGDERYDRYDRTAVPDANWSESRWPR